MIFLQGISLTFLTGFADQKVQEKTGRRRYNFKLSYVWGIPRTDDAEKIRKSSSVAVNDKYYSCLS